ncbi:halocyanin domain-containing protein [Halorarius litoreus]|uniref:halocyanin domain-containing protein n=1 Tax=Halorarius litoreus TaxID=2962676 RepID=UPI0020CC678E|nr:halocyanin domain-containing protein [Halorarius litoreus]
MNDSEFSRRRFLAATGSTALLAGLAGCSGGGGGDGGDGGGGDGGDGGDSEPTESPTESSGGDYTEAEQRVVDYLEADPADGTFDGEFVDATGQDEISVTVGSQGNGGAFAYDPVAFKISAGTTVSWEWSGEGGGHNVASDEPSDFDFTSGDPKQTGDPYTQSFDNTGVGLYFCEPHRSLGMKGGFVVVE